MSNVPGTWEAAVLVAAAYRVWRLIAHDVVLDSVRDGMFPPRKVAGGDVIRKHPKAFEFLQCPWCAGFWITIGVWALWLEWPHKTLVGCVPFALATFVGLIPRNLDP